MDLKTWWIAENAYYQWMDAGCPDGKSDEFWFAAERSFHVWLDAQGVKDAVQSSNQGEDGRPKDGPRETQGLAESCSLHGL